MKFWQQLMIRLLISGWHRKIQRLLYCCWSKLELLPQLCWFLLKNWLWLIWPLFEVQSASFLFRLLPYECLVSWLLSIEWLVHNRQVSQLTLTRSTRQSRSIHLQMLHLIVFACPLRLLLYRKRIKLLYRRLRYQLRCQLQLSYKDFSMYCRTSYTCHKDDQWCNDTKNWLQARLQDHLLFLIWWCFRRPLAALKIHKFE